jgi:signal transduction histidine kinase/DNA-binding response OmpR family regulator
MLRILHLEDSPTDAKLIQASLKLGFPDCEIRRVDSRAAFEASIRTFPADVILADYQLPSFDGGQALFLARELCIDTPFIFVTGALGEEIAIETLKRGATDYVLKQKLTRLVPAVRRAVAEAEERRARQKAQHEIETLNCTLQQRVQELQALFNVAPVGIAVAHDAECKDVSVNSAGAAMLGIPENSNVSDCLAPGNSHKIEVQQNGCELPTDKLPIQRAARTGQVIRAEEYEIVRADGSHVFQLQYASPLHDESNKVRGAVGIWVDISAYKRSEAALRKAREEAERLSRVKNEFLATLSHELRTPLTPVLGWLKMINMGRLSESEMHRGVGIMERNLQSLTLLVEDLLDISRIVVGKLRLEMARCDLRSVIETAYETVRQTSDAKGVEIHANIADIQISVMGDAARLQQVVWNLLSNAVKFTPRGGRVDLTAHEIDGVAELVVRDSGEGIEPDYIPHVFERFSQADSSMTRRFGGLGLGLAIVKHLIELHGGRVQASSPGKGKGACFTFRLPLAPATASSSRTTISNKVIREAHFPKGLRVLVVDDELDSREFVTFALERSGAEVVTAASVTEALQIFSEVHPKVVVTDISMPVLDGYALLRKLRETHSKLPVLALTAFARPEDKMRSLDAGFNFYLSKPVDPNSLVSVVAALADPAP